jgi:hypothetical protein
VHLQVLFIVLRWPLHFPLVPAFGCTRIDVGLVSAGPVVFVLFITSFPFVVGMPGGFLLVSGLGPLVEGPADAIVMGWSSSVGFCVSVRSIRLRLARGSVVYWLVGICVF